MPNNPLFQRCQVYDWPPFFDKKYMTDPIFLELNMHIFFTQRFLRLLVLLVFNELTALFV